jgi:hypothetical protein
MQSWAECKLLMSLASRLNVKLSTVDCYTIAYNAVAVQTSPNDVMCH